MSSDRLRRLNDLFLRALDRPVEERSAFLEGEAGEDAELRQAVAHMLALDSESRTLLDRPLVEEGWKARSIAGELPPLAAGQRLGPYRLIRQLGEGGMGLVFLAERDDQGFERRVALKVLRSGLQGDEMARRLRRERQILADLEHPHIARLLDGGATADGLPYLVMERVDGLPIDRFCDHHRLDLRQRVDLLLEVARAVHFAHQNLVVHRDLKPANILVQADGTPKLLDFGIAKLLAPSPAPDTATLLRILTPDYASPEQIRGGRITVASDVYSLGVVLYHLLTGVLPFDFGERSFEVIDRTLRERLPEPPSQRFSGGSAASLAARCAARRGDPAALRRQLQGDLEAIVLRALRSEPAQRYGSIERLVEDLERWRLGFPVQARRGSRLYRVGKFLRRHRLASAAVSGALVTLVVFSLVVAVMAMRLARERDRGVEIQHFLEEVFALADPGVGGGESWTVREALDRGALRLEGRLQEQPETRAELLQVIGKIYNNLGQSQQAGEVLERALTLRRELYGEGSAEVAATRSAWSQALLGLGRFDEAEAEARRAVELLQAASGERDPGLAEALNGLVSVLCHRSRFAEAAEPSERALALARGASPLVELQAVNNRAVVMRGLGDYERAATFYREGLAASRRLFGERHPLVLRLLGNLATVERRQGHYGAAVDHYRQGLEVSQQLFGADHRSQANLRSGLAVALGALQDEGAEEAYEAALASLETHYPAAFGQTLRIHAYFATFLLDRGRAAEAEALLAPRLVAWSRERPSDDVFVALVENTLGACAADRGRWSEAEALLLRSFEIIRAKDSGKREHARLARQRLVSLYQALDRPELVERYRQASLESETGPAAATGEG
ncbi:MAG: serine/threonine-protein kinase [Acidobacteriota bacterium]